MRCLPPSSSSHPTTLRLPLLVSQREGRARPSPRKAHREAFPRWWGGVSIFTSAPAVETPSSCPRGGRGATRQAVPRLPRSEQLREPGFRGESPDPQTPRQALPLRHELLGWAPPRRVPGGGDQDVACLCSATPGHAVFRVLATPRCPRACPPGHRTLPLLHSEVARAGAAARGPTPRVGPRSRGGDGKGCWPKRPFPLARFGSDAAFGTRRCPEPPEPGTCLGSGGHVPGGADAGAAEKLSFPP